MQSHKIPSKKRYNCIPHFVTLYFYYHSVPSIFKLFFMNLTLWSHKLFRSLVFSSKCSQILFYRPGRSNSGTCTLTIPCHTHDWDHESAPASCPLSPEAFPHSTLGSRSQSIRTGTLRQKLVSIPAVGWGNIPACMQELPGSYLCLKKRTLISR